MGGDFYGLRVQRYTKPQSVGGNIAPDCDDDWFDTVFVLSFVVSDHVFRYGGFDFYRHAGHDIARATRRDWPDGNYNCRSHDCCGERPPKRLAATVVAPCRYSRWNCDRCRM